MPRWVRENLCLTDADLVRAEPVIKRAEEIWKRHYIDEGSCVIGAGIGVLYIGRGQRAPRERIIIPTPGQGSGAESMKAVLDFLHLHGIAAFEVYGRLD